MAPRTGSEDLTGDGQRVYVVDPPRIPSDIGAFVVSLDPCTGGAISLGFTDLSGPSVFAFGGSAYFREDAIPGDEIHRGSPDGGAPSTVATVAAEVQAFAIDARNVYSVTSRQEVMLTPLDGGAQVEMAPSANTTIPVVDDTSVYVAMPTAIAQLDKLGATSRTLFPNGIVCAGTSDSLRVLAGDATNLYASTMQPNGVWQIPKDGTTPTQLVATSNCSSIAIDDAYVYFSETSPTSTNTAVIERVPKKGGAKEVVSNASAPRAIYVDSRSVYWVEDLRGVMKIDK